MLIPRKSICTRYKLSFILFLSTLFLIFSGYSMEKKVLFHEDFNSLDKWNPLYFSKIKEHTKYTLISDKQEQYLKAESSSSASALIYKNEFNIYDYPKARWRWKVENIYSNINPFTKSGDDYPLRIYFLFKFDPEKVSFLEKIKYGVLKKIYGDYPPHSSLNYVWSSREDFPLIYTSPYTDKVKIIVRQKGEKLIGKWIVEEADILKDYQNAFENKPPSLVSIAIMNDSDNTGSRAISYIDFIEIYSNVY